MRACTFPRRRSALIIDLMSDLSGPIDWVTHYPNGAPKTRKIAGPAIKNASSAPRQRGALTAASSNSLASGTMAVIARMGVHQPSGGNMPGLTSICAISVIMFLAPDDLRSYDY